MAGTFQERQIQLKKDESEALKAVGRPKRNPFHHTEVEQDFYVRTHAMVDKYYVQDPEKKNKPYIIDDVHMGKALFWACIFYLYTKEAEPAQQQFCPLFPDHEYPLADANVQYFLELLSAHFPPIYLPDRTLLGRKIALLNSKTIGYTTSHTEGTIIHNADLKKYRHIYHTVLKAYYEVAEYISLHRN